jgi:asparagine synthase (glutamine-hydrolysing)
MSLSGDVDFSSDRVSASLVSKSITAGVDKAQLRHLDRVQFPHLTIMADVRLDNRDELRRTLANEFRLSAPDDSDLLLAAYAKWGEGCGHFLLGEFSFAVWDDRLKRLFCCRDHMGFRAFFYWRGGGHFVFANRIEGVLAQPGVPRELNRRKFAALAVPTAHHVRHEETFHAGVFSLPPGSWMTVQREGVRQQKYWDIDLEALPAVPKRREEAFEALREVLFRAVECRMDREAPVAALLSGGLDSSAIVSIAARCLEKQNRQLTAVAAVLPAENRGQFCDEREYIDEFRSWPNVSIKYVTAPGRGPFDSLHDQSRFTAHPLQSSRVFLVDECEKAATDSGCRSLLCGTGGELGVTCWSNRYLVDLAARLRWLTLARELKNGQTYRNGSSVRRLAGQFLDILHPLRGQTQVFLIARGIESEYHPKPIRGTRSPYQRQFQAGQIRLWLRKHAIEDFMTLPESQPLIDKRVLEFCLALPADLNVHDGYPRYFVRGALDGILPPRIQWRTDKVAFSPDYTLRYNAQLGMAREYVAAIGPSDPVRSVIDVDSLGKLLNPADRAGNEGSARDTVPGTLYAIRFLRQFSEFRP